MVLSWVSNSTAQGMLRVLHYVNPIVLLFFFLFAFTLRSILSATADQTAGPSSTETGPGGKPLPKKHAQQDKAFTASLDFSKSRKLLFDWLSVVAAVTFLANAGAVITHSLVDRKDGWWCGKSVVVRQDISTQLMVCVDVIYSSTLWHRSSSIASS